ncbi:hypothetical protein Pst134EB_026540 [Puccinia striiformis f. sp. tritici]|nr:hypothetical protein Pst134EB_026540 [Puccinia striiformis f. sp. tritici]
MAYTENHESSPAHLRAVAKRKAELEMFQKDFTNITTNVVPPFTTLTPSAVSPTGDMELDDPGPQQEPFDHEVEESQQEYPVLHSDSDVGFGSESDCSGVEDVQPVNWTEFLLSHSNPVNQPEIAENAVVPSKAAWAPFRSQEHLPAAEVTPFYQRYSTTPLGFCSKIQEEHQDAAQFSSQGNHQCVE